MKGVDTEIGLGCIGFAVEQLRAGERVARKGWNGEGISLILVPDEPLNLKVRGAPLFLEGILAKEYILEYSNVGGEEVVSTWSPSISDTLADDWCIV